MGAPVTTASATTLFFAGAAVSLASSWIVVSRIERVGGRLGASEALLGLVSALAADAPEITSSVSALLQHHGDVGAGVVIGSNVFNLAALLGIGSVVAGFVALHRKVVVFEGVIALWVALACALTVAGLVGPLLGLVIVLVVLVPYAALAALDRSAWWRRPGPSRWRRWLVRAVEEEELELRATIHPRRAKSLDVLVAGVSLVVVVVASVLMEHSATFLGTRLAVPGIVVGAVVLAAVTSLPNMVAAIYWARRGRGMAMLSTALNSNALNVAAGLLLPAVLLGFGHRSSQETLVVVWYGGLTAVVLVLAYVSAGLRRGAGWLIIGAYVAFIAVVVAVS
ncbi:MAG: hypothetical protein ACRDWE_06560 [Acidimicrobiales bacterium]